MLNKWGKKKLKKKKGDGLQTGLIVNIFFTLFLDRGTASLCCPFNNQGTGEGHELLNTE